MTVKEFFKSKTFKCILTLLIVLLFSGALLTVAYGFLEVTGGERLQLAVKKIYSGAKVRVYGKDDKEITASETSPEGLVTAVTAVGNSEIMEMYKIVVDGEDGYDYLVKSKGKGGFSGGNVVCWIAFPVQDGKISAIRKVSIDSNQGQSYISKISDNELKRFSEDYEEGKIFTYGAETLSGEKNDEFIKTGASYSLSAICNSVNGAVKFVSSRLSGEEIVDKFANFMFTQYIDKENTSFTVEESSITYNITTISNKQAGAFTLKITVGADKTISSYEVIVYGSTPNSYAGLDAEHYNSKINVDLYIGKGESYFKSVIGENGDITDKSNYEDNNIATGATRSNFLCLYAGLFATANYDNCILGGNAQ